MSKFKKMLEKTAAASQETMQVTKMPETNAPKKDNVVEKSLPKTKEVAEILDMMYILKSAKNSIGQDLNAKDLAMFSSELHEKAATQIADVAAVIPSGFSGRFIQDMYAMTGLEGLVGMETINAFGMTDTIGSFGMEAFVVSELNTPTDTNDSMIDFEYRGGKLMAKSYMSYEALADAAIDMLASKRNGLMRAMAVAVEKAILNGQSGDTGISGADARTLFRGLRKYGLAKQTVDFGGAALTEAVFRSKILEMQEAGDLYTSWEEIAAGNVVLLVPNSVYNKILEFDTFVDASKAGVASTLASGRKVSTVFGIPVTSNRFFPASVDATGVVSATGANNTFQSILLVNLNTVKAYAVAGSALMETFKDIETQKYVLTASNRLGFASIFDQKSASPSTIDATKNNIVAGINIKL
jgi:HK97 family phage major capsid protein